MNHRLLILGSSEEFIQLVNLAKQRNIETIVCDGNPEGPARNYADKTYTVDVREIDRIAEICLCEHADGIITAFSDLLLECMVRIADKASLPCFLTPDQLDYYRNKDTMKQMFRLLSVPTPRYLRLKPDFSGEELKDFQFPVVTKPLDKYGSRGVLVLDSEEEIRRSYYDICSSSDVKEILIEEYNPGYEFNLMAWVSHGEVHILGIADREKTEAEPKTIPVCSRNVYPSCLMPHVLDDAKQILQKIVQYTGQKEGELSMQFFWTPQKGMEVCEVAARFLGYEHELIELCSGFSLEELLLNYVYEPEKIPEMLRTHNPCFETSSAVLYFHGRERRIADMNAAERCMASPELLQSWLFYKTGEQVQKFTRPYVARCYIKADTRAELDALTDRIFSGMSITDPSGEEILYRNQRPDYDASLLATKN